MTSISMAAYASRSASPPIVTIATAPSKDAAGRVSRSQGSPCAAMSKYVTTRMPSRREGTSGLAVWNKGTRSTAWPALNLADVA